jgi:serine/threonine-protein kinase RsbW
MTDSRHTLNWAAPPDDVEAVHDFLESIWPDFPEVDSMDRMIFETAIVELASNVIEHADPGQEGISCVLVVHTVDHTLRAELRDTAQAGAFRLSTRVMPGSEAESGRGIALIQAMVDKVSYERSGEFNVWTISKSLEG